MGLRVLVCSDVHFAWDEMLKRVLWDIHRMDGIEWIIHTNEKGAAKMAGQWALDNGVSTMTFKAEVYGHPDNWETVRNRAIFEEGEPDLVVAFPGEENLVAVANVEGVLVYEPFTNYAKWRQFKQVFDSKKKEEEEETS